MVDKLASTVTERTKIPERYRRAAAPESMGHYVADWELAHARLGRAIDRLRALRDERSAERARGDWPPPTPEPSPAEARVTSLMDDLERAVADARAARRRLLSEDGETP